jgi:hypothetical protein
MNLNSLTKAQLLNIIEDLKVSLDQRDEVVDNANEKSENLPMQAVSLYEENGKFNLVTIKYNPKTLEAVVLPEKESFEKNMSHMATFEMKKRNTLNTYKNVVKE